MPKSCKTLIRKCVFKGAITKKEGEKLMRNFNPIIRCEGCKYRNGHLCDIHPEVWITDKDYCSFAQPRKEDKNG